MPSLQDTSSSNRRIARNTLMLYVRMLLKMTVALYTSRVILDYLGVTDFGIYNLVGGVVVLFGFLNSSMSISVQRFLTFEMGKNGLHSRRINTIFSMSIVIHFCIAVLLFVLAQIAGYFLLDHLNIPPDRSGAAAYLFQLSILACCCTFLYVPYTALIISYEKMDGYAYISVAEVFLKLGIVFLLPLIPIDRLVCYGYLTLAVSIIILLLYQVYCKRAIKDIQFRREWDKELFRPLLGFASWTAMGEFSWTAIGQGVSIVLGLFFGPAVNAARAIAVQVQGALNQFVANFQTAMNPQIVKLYAANETSQMLGLTYRGIRFSFFLMLFISLPFLFNMDYLLSLWLKEVPAHTASFCRLAVIGSFADLLSNLLSTVAKATGKIRKYQMCVSACLFMNFPLSYICLKSGLPAEMVYIVYISMSLMLLAARMWLLRHTAHRFIGRYISEVALPVIRVALVALPLPLVIMCCQGDGCWGVLTSSLSCLVSSGIAIFFLGLTRSERSFIAEKLHNILKR